MEIFSSETLSQMVTSLLRWSLALWIVTLAVSWPCKSEYASIQKAVKMSLCICVCLDIYTKLLKIGKRVTF